MYIDYIFWNEPLSKGTLDDNLVWHLCLESSHLHAKCNAPNSMGRIVEKVYFGGLCAIIGSLAIVAGGFL